MKYFFKEFNVLGSRLVIEFFSSDLQQAIEDIGKLIDKKDLVRAKALTENAISQFDCIPELVKLSTLISFLEGDE